MYRQILFIQIWLFFSTVFLLSIFNCPTLHTNSHFSSLFTITLSLSLHYIQLCFLSWGFSGTIIISFCNWSSNYLKSLANNIMCKVALTVLEANLYPKDTARCIEFCADEKSENYPIKMLELFQNNNARRRAMSFGWTWPLTFFYSLLYFSGTDNLLAAYFHPS